MDMVDGYDKAEQIRRATEVLDELLNDHPDLYGKIELNFQGGNIVNSNITHAGPRRERK